LQFYPTNFSLSFSGYVSMLFFARTTSKQKTYEFDFPYPPIWHSVSYIPSSKDNEFNF
jgi:hypothetical protein